MSLFLFVLGAIGAWQGLGTMAMATSMLGVFKLPMRFITLNQDGTLKGSDLLLLYIAVCAFRRYTSLEAKTSCHSVFFYR